MSLNNNTTELEAILRTVNELPAAGEGGGVSVQADWDQTDVTAPDFIKNKPFGDTGDTLRWDGNIEGCFPMLDVFWMPSPTTPPSFDALSNGGVITVSLDGVLHRIEYTAENVGEIDGLYAVLGEVVAGGEEEPLVVCVPETAVETWGVPAGVYLFGITDATTSIYVSSLKINNYTGFPSKIDKKYLPDSIFSDLERLNNEQPADYVVAEASAVVDKVISREGANPFRFIAFADAHQKNDDADISNGNRDAGHGIAEVLKLMGAEFVGFLGDSTWASAENDTEASVIEQQKAFNRYFGDALKGEQQLRLEGNHETDFLSENAIQTMIYGYNRDVVKDAGHEIEGYCYKDFEAHKIRVVCLNTNQLANGGMNGNQLKWFAETALDMTGKTDWSLMILSHHPLDYNAATLFVDAISILDAFIDGGTVSITTRDTNEAISVDYAEKNCAFIANFHGHAHAFSVTRLQKRVATDTYEDINGYAICIPNTCFTRNNQYIGESYDNNPYVKKYTTETTYNKTAGTAESTSFNVVTVCTDTQMIYLDVYGAGIDREVVYRFGASYTNLIPESVDTDGSIYNGKGFKEDTYISGATIATRDGVELTGFMPVNVTTIDGTLGQVIVYFGNMREIGTNTNCRISFFGETKNYLNQQNNFNQMVDESAYTGNNVVKYMDADGYVTHIDITAPVNYMQNQGTPVKWIRICHTNITEDSIITINEPIE